QQAEQAERPPLQLSDPPVAKREACPYLEVTHRQLIQPPVVRSKPVGQPLDPPMRLGGKPGAHDPQRQRQIPARGGDLCRRRGLGGHPVPTGAPGARPPRGAPTGPPPGAGRPPGGGRPLCPAPPPPAPAGRTPRSIPPAKVSPASRARLVTSTAFPAPAGSSGRTCVSSAAL